MKSSEPEFITVGRILSPWGIKGEIRVEVVTEFPERFALSSNLYVNRQPVTINRCSWHKGKAIIKLHTINSAEDAQRLRGQFIEIHHSQLKPLPEGQYYHFQLIGLEIWTIQGELLGNITEILTSKSNDTYIVHGDKGEILIPAIEDVIKSINLDAGRVIIEPIEGLFS